MKIKFFLSAALSLFFGGLAFLFLMDIRIPNGLPLSILAALLFFLLLFLFLMIQEKTLNRRYSPLEDSISSPIFYKATGNFDLGAGEIRNGRIYFCEDGIVCSCMDKKPYTLDQIAPGEIQRIAYDEIHLHIYLQDGRVFRITLPSAKTVIALLQQRDWVQ